MSLFLSTDDGRVLLAHPEERRTLEMADFETPLTGLVLDSTGQLYGATDRLVYRLDIGSGARAPVALIANRDIAGLAVDGSDRLVIGSQDGFVRRLMNDGRLIDAGQFTNGIEGGVARIGKHVYAAGSDGVLSSMHLPTGEVTQLRLLGLGTVLAINAEGGTLRLTIAQPSGFPQFFRYDPRTGTLEHETGLLSFYDRITGATEGEIGTVIFSGQPGRDEYIGTALADVMTGSDTDVRFFARDGDDTVTGGIGDDVLFGEWGNDAITGGLGDDLLEGESGDDTLEGGAGDDWMDGGEGADWAVFTGATARVDLLTGNIQDTGHGLDRLLNIENLRGSGSADVLGGSYFANVLQGRAGGDKLLGRDGDDTLMGGAGKDLLRGGEGDDLLDGGAGFDMASYAGPQAVTVSLAAREAQDTGRGTDMLLRIEGLAGSSGADRLSGNGQANRLEGRAGADTLRGGGGTDTLMGQKGNDLLLGGAGADVLMGNGGNDTLDGDTGAGIDTYTGGTGADTFVFTVVSLQGATDDLVVITDFAPAQGDRIDLVGATPDQLDQWTLTANSEGTRVTFTNGTQLQLDGVAPAEIEAGWFL